MKLKKIAICLSLLVLAGALSAGIWAACGGSILIQNAASGYQNNVAGAPDSTFYTKYWAVGTGGANNSGTITSAAMVTNYAANQWYVYTDWGNTGVLGCANSGRMAFVYSIANGGSAQYLVMSVAYDAVNGFNFDNISNGPGNVPTPVNVPTIASVTAAGPLGDNSYDLTITWTPISNLQGYYDAPPANIITGVAAYRFNGAAPPANFAKSAWTLASGGPSARTGYVTFAGPDPGTMIVNVPGPIANVDYLALTVLFDGATPGDAIRETQFVGPYFSKPIGPTAAPLFANVTADPTTVAWTSGDESRVASYQAFWSPTISGTYKALGQPVAAQGSGHSYSVGYRIATGFVYYVKIKASKTDGTFVWSTPVKVTRLATEPKPLPGKLGVRK